MTVSESVLDAIGNTPLVRLRRVVPEGSARVFVKVEGANPTGSMKDRMAKAAIEAAEASGALRPGGTVVEYTGGSTGTSLGLVCAAKGYRCRIVTSDAFSQEKRDHMAALGAEITVVPSDGGRITEALIKEMIERARAYSREPGTFWTDQLNNRDASAGYFAMGDEIWAQTGAAKRSFGAASGVGAERRRDAGAAKRSSEAASGTGAEVRSQGDAGGRVDAFVQSVGTAHSIQGASAALRRYKPDIRVVAVEPAESPVLSEGRTGAHRIEGIGIGFVPPLWDPLIADEILTVSTDDAKAMARRLAREEALFAGTSSGANVVAALRIAERLGADATVVTILVDSGLKYLTTDVYRSTAQ